VLAAYTHTMQAAEQLGTSDETRQRIRQIVAQESVTDRFVGRSLKRVLWEG
jgi:ferritin-like metal-binding protein YciE